MMAVGDVGKVVQLVLVCEESSRNGVYRCISPALFARQLELDTRRVKKLAS